MCLFLGIWMNCLSQSQIDAYSLATSSADIYSPKRSVLNRNPASIVDLQHHGISVNSILPYGLSSLRSSSIGYTGKVWQKPLGLEYSISNFEQYSEHLIAFATGLKIAEHWNVGIKLIDKIIRAEENNRSIWHVELGVVEKHSKNLSTALHFSYKNKQEDVDLNQTKLAIGIQYQFNSFVKNFTCVEANNNSKIAMRTAFTFDWKKSTQLHLGFSSVDAPISTGISLSVYSIDVNLSTSYHQQLGISYGMGLCYVMRK